MARYSTPTDVDLFAVPLEQKIALLGSRRRDAPREGNCRGQRATCSLFARPSASASTEGSYIEQSARRVPAAASSATAGRARRRCADALVPQQPGPPAGHGSGYELVLRHRHAGRTVSRSPKRRSPSSRPSSARRGVTTIISRLISAWLCRCTNRADIPIELDRVLAPRASYAGTSFLTHGEARRASATVRMSSTSRADATIPGGLGSLRLRRRGRAGAERAHHPQWTCSSAT